MKENKLYELFLNSTGVSIDTRTIKGGNIFFAITGVNFDGNQYAEKAIALGAKFAIVDNVLFESDKCILVDNTLKALQNIATYHRRKLNIPILALTGSNGKTTTKELIASVLKSKFNLSYTKGNLNNHIGVPLTLLSFNDSTEFGIVEMGANHLREIADLCEIAEPNYGLITNIGKAHIGEFGGLENIKKAKGELYDYLNAHNGEVIYNDKDEVLLSRCAHVKNKVSYSDLLKDEYELTILKNKPHIEFSLGEQKLRVNTDLGGDHNVKNLTTTIAIAHRFNINPKAIKSSLESFIVPDNRSQWIDTEKNRIFLDAYNANPSSMESAIEYFSSVSNEKIAILGEMLELGDFAKEEHDYLISFVSSKDITCYFIGESFDKAKHPNVFTNKNDFLENVDLTKLINKSILIKASRGMKLETIVDLL